MPRSVRRWTSVWQRCLRLTQRVCERVQQRFVEADLAACLKQRRRVRQSLLDGEPEAHLIALACSPAPEGHAWWTLRLLAEHLVELAYVESIAHETVRQTLKKRLPTNVLLK